MRKNANYNILPCALSTERKEKMGRLFGTDGARGVANQELTCELAFKIGQAAAFVLTEESHRKPKILIGKDTRISCDMLESALAAGLCSVGAKVVTLGVIPTPAVAYLTRKYDAEAGIMISASHNSAEYNGIKIFNANGYKLSDVIEERIEAIILDNSEEIDLPTGDDVGTVEHSETAVADYIEFVKSVIDCDLNGMRVAIDCANGASCKTAAKVISSLGGEPFVIHNHPNGTNINLHCGSTHMQDLCNYVKNVGVDIGLAFDGDADRMLASDENGNFVDGDKIMAICALELKKCGMLKNNTVVATVMSNLGFFNALKSNGIEYAQTKVGDRYVLENMLENGHCIGGEQSGHIIFLDYNTTGDGLMTAVRLVSALRDSGKKMSELAEIVNILPQVLVNAKIKNEYKSTYMNDPDIAAAIKDIEDKFAGNGRVLIRPSGTEPLVRVMIEGEDIDVLTNEANSLASLIESRLG